MNEQDYFDFRAKLSELGISTIDQRMGITILEATPARLVGTMPVEGNTQVRGILHGGANVVLAESLGSIGTALHAGLDRRIVGVDINATHHKSVSKGIVTGVATPIHLGNTVCTYEIVITNEEGERTCTARITCLILAKR